MREEEVYKRTQVLPNADGVWKRNVLNVCYFCTELYSFHCSATCYLQIWNWGCNYWFETATLKLEISNLEKIMLVPLQASTKLCSVKCFKQTGTI